MRYNKAFFHTYILKITVVYYTWIRKAYQTYALVYKLAGATSCVQAESNSSQYKIMFGVCITLRALRYLLFNNSIEYMLDTFSKALSSNRQLNFYNILSPSYFHSALSPSPFPLKSPLPHASSPSFPPDITFGIASIPISFSLSNLSLPLSLPFPSYHCTIFIFLSRFFLFLKSLLVSSSLFSSYFTQYFLLPLFLSPIISLPHSLFLSHPYFTQYYLHLPHFPQNLSFPLSFPLVFFLKLYIVISLLVCPCARKIYETFKSLSLSLSLQQSAKHHACLCARAISIQTSKSLSPSQSVPLGTMSHPRYSCHLLSIYYLYCIQEVYIAEEVTSYRGYTLITGAAEAYWQCDGLQVNKSAD